MDELLIEGLDCYVGYGTKQAVLHSLTNDENDFQHRIDFLIQLKSLSKEAKYIVDLIFNPNKELRKTIKNKRIKRLTQNDLRKYLRNEGWKYVVISRSFKEIEEFFKLNKKHDIICSNSSIPLGVQIKKPIGGFLMGKESKEMKLVKKYCKELKVKIKNGATEEDIIDAFLSAVEKKCKDKKWRDNKKNQPIVDLHNEILDKIDEEENNNNNNNDDNNDNNNNDNNNNNNNNDDNDDDEDSNNNDDDEDEDSNNNDDDEDEEENNDDDNDDDEDEEENNDDNNDDDEDEDNNNDNDDNNNNDDVEEEENNDNNNNNNNNNDDEDEEEEEETVIDYTTLTKAKELRDYITDNKLGRKCKGYKEEKNAKKLKAMIAKATGEDKKVEEKTEKKEKASKKTAKKTEKKDKKSSKKDKKEKEEKVDKKSKKDKKSSKKEKPVKEDKKSKKDKKSSKKDKAEKDAFGSKVGSNRAKVNAFFVEGGTMAEIEKKVKKAKIGISVKEHIKYLKDKGCKLVIKGKKDEKTYKLKSK